VAILVFNLLWKYGELYQVLFAVAAGSVERSDWQIRTGGGPIKLAEEGDVEFTFKEFAKPTSRTMSFFAQADNRRIRRRCR
jgi:hypothetical protein